MAVDLAVEVVIRMVMEEDLEGGETATVTMEDLAVEDSVDVTKTTTVEAADLAGEEMMVMKMAVGVAAVVDLEVEEGLGAVTMVKGGEDLVAEEITMGKTLVAKGAEVLVEAVVTEVSLFNNS